jgi:hypothetical protein
MPSRISCKENHSTKTLSLHQAAIALSEGQSLGACKKCGSELQYRIEHAYPNDPDEKEYSFVVTRAVRLKSRLADDETFDPFLLVLRDTETGKQQVLPAYWFSGQSNTPRAGHSSPLLTLAQWKKLFSQLDAAFQGLEERIRLRAYELYEQRGNRGGSALEDWLQAEAELTPLKSFRAAA